MPECTTGFNKFYCGSLHISFLYIMDNCCLFWLIFLYENVAVQLLYYTYENKIQNWKNWKKFQYLWILTGASTGVYSGEVHDWQQKKLHHSQSVRPDCGIQQLGFEIFGTCLQGRDSAISQIQGLLLSYIIYTSVLINCELSWAHFYIKMHCTFNLKNSFFRSVNMDEIAVQ